ncbi:MAG: hypothetical protein ACRDGE_06025, partial [Candidatus Limnocylindria bacterium]
PLLELSEERRRAIVASLPERKERFGFFAPLRRLGPALPAAAALLFVAAFVALATQLPGGGDDDAGEAGMAMEEAAEEDRATEESAEEPAGGERTSEAFGEDEAEALASGELVARVEGPAGEVVLLLRRSGHVAFVRDGSVVVVGDAREIRAELVDRPSGPVRVFARSP